MIIASAELFRQATDSLSHAAFERPLTRGVEVMQLVQHTLDATQPAPILPSAEEEELQRLAEAFRPLSSRQIAPEPRGAAPNGKAGVSAAPEPPAPSRPPTLRLKTVLTVRGVRSALIEGQNGTLTVQTGSRIGKERVIRIESDHLVLAGPYGERLLGFDDATE